jgi:hypothetical protein
MKDYSLRVRMTFNNTKIMCLHSSTEEGDGIRADRFYCGVLTKFPVTMLTAIDFSVANSSIFWNLNFSHKKIHTETWFVRRISKKYN